MGRLAFVEAAVLCKSWCRHERRARATRADPKEPIWDPHAVDANGRVTCDTP